MKGHLKCKRPEIHRVLLHLLKGMMNVNGQNTLTYKPFHIRMSKSSFVVGIRTPTCRYVTFGRAGHWEKGY